MRDLDSIAIIRQTDTQKYTFGYVIKQDQKGQYHYPLHG